MNINGLGSLSWYTSQRSTSSTGSNSLDSQDSSTDSAAFSAAGFAALLQSQSGPPQMTDDMASTIGASIKEKNADLFSALDSDGDGSLSATELKSGMDALRGSSGGPPPMPGQGGPPELTDEQASAIGTSLQKDNASLFSALDSDGDGTLSASELKAGTDSLHDAMKASGMGPPPPPSGLFGSGDDQSGGSTSMSDFKSNLMSQILQSMFATQES